MERGIQKLFPVTLCISSWIGYACSEPARREKPPLFVGHSLGENSGAWAAKEPNQNIDPLAKCQQVVQSLQLDESLQFVKSCREFVDRGFYQIDIRDSKEPEEKIFRFTNWRLTTIILKFGNAERSQVLADLDSRFTNTGQLWQTKNADFIEILPATDLEKFTGIRDHSEGFLVVVSAGTP